MYEKNKEEENNLDKKIEIYNHLRITVLLIFIAVILIISLFIYFRHNTLTCSANPFLYGAKEISKDNNNAEVYCKCVAIESSGTGKFSFTQEQFNPPDDPFLNPKRNINNPLIFNNSLLKKINQT